MKHSQNNFITHNIKIKGNKPYPILLIEAGIFPIKSTIINRYLMYKNKINNMDDKRLPIIASNSSQNHLWLKQRWHKDAKTWLYHQGIKKEVILSNNNDIKNISISKFKENLWCDKESEDKKKLRYYKEVINPNLEDQKYLSILINVKNKIC
jgi:hypothetical protein